MAFAEIVAKEEMLVKTRTTVPHLRKYNPLYCKYEQINMNVWGFERCI